MHSWLHPWRRIAALAVAAGLVAVVHASEPGADDPAAGATRMLRMPTVSASHIAFAYAGNIWIVPRAGGMARRVTSFQGQATNPQLSPDGRQLAFSADYAGNPDVYVVPVDGGEPTRLTWHPGADVVQGWSPDGARILFTSARATAAPNATTRFWTVAASGGPPAPLPLPRGYQGKFSPDGRAIAYRMNSSWDEERRNYRGGQNKAIWIADVSTWEVVTPPWSGSKEMDPVWLDGTVYFLSDRDGVSNVWSYAPATKALAQVTRFTDFDVKTLGSGGGALVFEQAGYVHLLDPKAGKPAVVPITVAGDFPWMMPHWEDVTARMTSLDLSPTGKRVLVEARGEIFTIPGDKGDIRNLTRTSGAAEREPAWSPDGRFVSYFSDASGEYRLVIESQDGLAPPREIALAKPTRYYSPAWSPDSRKLLYSDTNLNVWVLDVETGAAKIVGRDPWMVPSRTLAPSWSPDSRWVAFASRLDTLYRAIVVANVETGEQRQITDGLADATYPVWDASGRYLWFLASTDFGLASQWLDMTSYEHLQTFGLYVALLRKGDPSPLLPESDEDAGVGAKSEPTPLTASTQPVTIDFDGLQQRVIPVAGVPERQYSRLAAGAAGTVFYLEAPPVAQRGGPPPATGSTLHRYRLSDRRAVTFAPNVAAFAVSADGKQLVYRRPSAPGGGGRPPAAPTLHLVAADGAVPENGSGRLSVTLRMDLDQIG
ncbi:MAG: protease, partial [Vicinamibacterales bacterium]